MHRVRFEITVVGVVITFVRVKITMRVKIILHCAIITLMCVIFTRIRVKITLLCVESNATLRVKSNFACGNRTLG
jgi:hypothetical protein